MEEADSPSFDCFALRMNGKSLDLIRAQDERDHSVCFRLFPLVLSLSKEACRRKPVEGSLSKGQDEIAEIFTPFTLPRQTQIATIVAITGIN